MLENRSCYHLTQSLFLFSALPIVNNEAIRDSANDSRLHDGADTQIYTHTICVVDATTLDPGHPGSYFFVVLYAMIYESTALEL